jgi:hypothetical protein
VISQIEEAARRSHDDIRATSHSYHLRIDRYAAEHDEHLDRPRQVTTEAPDRFTHLDRELSRGNQNEAAHAPVSRRRSTQQSSQHRQRKCRRLA